MSADKSLGDYLRARRELVMPDGFGLPTGGQRRVSGLRREEVAMLAGISPDYYLRLEQGRNHNPSMQVLESLARVFKLDETATSYLIELASDHIRTRTRRRRADVVPEGIRQLIGGMDIPAYVESRHFDVVAANSLAEAVSPNLCVGQNRMRAIFLDPAEQALCPNFERARAHMVAGFRRSVGTDADDPRYQQLVGELSLKSEQFRRLWARHDVHVREGGTTTMNHPLVGKISFFKERLLITGGVSGLVLVLYQPVSDTRNSAEKLRLLFTRASAVDPAAYSSSV